MGDKFFTLSELDFAVQQISFSHGLTLPYQNPWTAHEDEHKAKIEFADES